jgi:hypothetical protein
VTLKRHVSFKALALGLPNREVPIHDSGEHVSFRALALGLPNREALCGSYEHVSFGALALGLPEREVLCDSEEHVSFRALALPSDSLTGRSYVTRWSTFRVGR